MNNNNPVAQPPAIPGQNQELTGFNGAPTIQAENSMALAESSRAVAEIKAQMAVAKMYPRNEARACEKILTASKRLGMAEKAFYAFKRGTSMVNGETIHFAKMLASYWGNINYGFQELERGEGESTMQAYCIDMENNTRSVRVFVVKHERETKKGSYALTGQRDIYEQTANMATRRLRACIFDQIPSDIIEDAKNAVIIL